jgi:hypothetical protein
MNRSRILFLLVVVAALVPLAGHPQSPSVVRSTARNVHEPNACSQVRTTVLERLIKAAAGKKTDVFRTTNTVGDPGARISATSCPVDKAVAARAVRAGLPDVVDNIVCIGSGDSTMCCGGADSVFMCGTKAGIIMYKL